MKQKEEKEKCWRVGIGVTETLIFVLFTVFYVLLVLQQRNVTQSYHVSEISKAQMFSPALDKIEFANLDQMKYYLRNDLGKLLIKDRSSIVKTFWDYNILLPYFKVHLIRGLIGPCPFTSRPGLSSFFN